MGREDPQLKLRLTEEMKNAVTEAARNNNRSVNAEIVARLETSFQITVDPKALAQAYEFTEDLRARLEKAWEQFNLDVERFNHDVEQLNASRREAHHEDMRRRKEREDIIEERERRFRDRQRTFRDQIKERRVAIREEEARLREEEKRMDDLIARLIQREAELGELIKNLTKNTAGNR